jgi:CHAD domain-containing protein
VEPRAALLVILEQRLETMLDAMPAAQAGDTRSVHQARVATRRLREALPVLRGSMNGAALSRLRRQVRKMTRALGPVRELDVSLAHLDQLAAGHVVSSRALGAVRQALARERAARRREMLATITPGRLNRLRERLTRVSTGAAAPAPATATEEARRQVGKRAGRLLATVERAGGLYLADRLHAVRVAAKKLRYALEIERELKRSRSTARITQLKRLQDLLGRMHDFEVLIDRTREVQANVAGRDRALTLELDTLVRTLEAECRRDHATYMRRRGAILELCRTLAQAEPGGEPAVA